MVVSTAVKRAVLYTRVSSTGQAGERHVSLDTQTARGQAHAERQGYTLVHTFSDVMSGRRDDRRAYREMVDFVQHGGADIIVVQFLDRFGRNPREILSRIWQLKEHGIIVEATDEDLKDDLVLLVRAGLAGAESRRTSERVRANMARAVGRGVLTGKAPFGYRRIYVTSGDKLETKIEQHPLEAPVVREMVRLAVEENLGYKSIADRIGAQGHLARNGKYFASYTIEHVMTNEALKGTLTYGQHPRKGNPRGEVVRLEGFFPAILTNDEWDALQQRLAIRRSTKGKAQASDYLLSGLVRCGYCGGPMIGKSSYAYKGRHYRNYWCGRAQRSRAQCAYYNGHSARKLEAAVIEHLSQYADPTKARELLAADDRRDVARKEKELRQAEKRLADLEAQFHRHVDRLDRGVLSEGDFKRLNEAARDERSSLEARREELAKWLAEARGKADAAESLPKRIGSFLEEFEHLDVRRQKAHLQAILKAATVYRDGRVELAFRV